MIQFIMLMDRIGGVLIQINVLRLIMVKSLTVVTAVHYSRLNLKEKNMNGLDNLFEQPVPGGSGYKHFKIRKHANRSHNNYSNCNKK